MALQIFRGFDEQEVIPIAVVNGNGNDSGNGEDTPVVTKDVPIGDIFSGKIIVPENIRDVDTTVISNRDNEDLRNILSKEDKKLINNDILDEADEIVNDAKRKLAGEVLTDGQRTLLESTEQTKQSRGILTVALIGLTAILLLN